MEIRAGDLVTYKASSIRMVGLVTRVATYGRLASLYPSLRTPKPSEAIYNVDAALVLRSSDGREEVAFVRGLERIG